MKKIFNFLFWLIIITVVIKALNNGGGGGGGGGGGDSDPPILCRALSLLSPSSSPRLLKLNKLVGLLGIIGDVCIFMTRDGKARDDDAVNEGRVRVSDDESRYFYPTQFANRHGIDNEDDVRRQDRKVKQDLRECTEEVLKSGESVFNKQLEMRSACLRNKGYDDNDQTYIDLKFPTTGT